MDDTGSYFVAKQPILDAQLVTYGYELLFRSKLEEQTATIDDPDMATVNVVVHGFLKTQEEIKQSKRIFVNFTEHLLLKGAPRALPPAVTVIEILEDTRMHPELLEEIIKYKQEGYFIAIDDYTGEKARSGLLDYADIIKVDVLGKRTSEISTIFDTIKDKKALKLAEKVADRFTYRTLRNLGFDLFQGYFFARPENLGGRKIGSSLSSRIRILSALQQPELETDQLAELITLDPGIAYRLLRLLNSAAFGFSMKIESIRHGVTLLGSKRIKYWLQMVILADISVADNPQELFHLALSRGKLLQELAESGLITTTPPESLFLFGLLSLLNVMLSMPFTDIFAELPLTTSLVDGYLNPDSPMAQYLLLFTALEEGDHSGLETICRRLEISPESVVQTSVQVHNWTESILSELL